MLEDYKKQGGKLVGKDETGRFTENVMIAFIMFE